MATKPYQSKLIPYEDEIMKLRRRRPPMTYAQIAETLRQKHNLIIQRSAICKFIKVRKGGRKVYGYDLKLSS
jgi:reverse gyrase